MLGAKKISPPPSSQGARLHAHSRAFLPREAGAQDFGVPDSILYTHTCTKASPGIPIPVQCYFTQKTKPANTSLPVSSQLNPAPFCTGDIPSSCPTAFGQSLFGGNLTPYCTPYPAPPHGQACSLERGSPMGPHSAPHTLGGPHYPHCIPGTSEWRWEHSREGPYCTLHTGG